MGFPLPYSQLVSDLRYLQLGQAPRLIGENVVWDDLVFDLTTTRRGASSKPDFDATECGLLFPQNDPAEIVYVNVQMPHRWLEGRTVYPHVHWHQSSADLPVWKLDYRWIALGEAVGSWTTGYTMNYQVFEYTSGTLSQISTNLVGIDGTGKGISSILQIKLYRDDNVLAGDALAVSFDLHHEIDSMGSETEFYKGW
jgi:hypothetical protein